MKKLTLRKDAIAALSSRLMGRIIGKGNESGQSALSTAPCRCDAGEDTQMTAECITNPNNGCSVECTVYSCNCGGGSNTTSVLPDICNEAEDPSIVCI